jgi:hypothetical protein
MPWTFAHPAAVLPLRRLCPRWLSLPALILGTLAPDLGYYAGLLDWSTFCHTPLGIAAGCLPLGLVLLALLLRFSRLLTVLIPAPHRQIVRGQLQRPARALPIELAVAVLSILLGAATHVLWDSFTHAGRWGVALAPFLDEPAFIAAGRQFRVFNVLQHLSTALGLAAMAVVYRRTIRSQTGMAPPSSAALEGRRIRLLLAGIGCSVLIGILAAYGLAQTTESASVSLFVVRAVVWSTTCFVALFLTASLAWRRRWGDA